MRSCGRLSADSLNLQDWTIQQLVIVCSHKQQYPNCHPLNQKHLLKFISLQNLSEIPSKYSKKIGLKIFLTGLRIRSISWAKLNYEKPFKKSPTKIRHKTSEEIGFENDNHPTRRDPSIGLYILMFWADLQIQKLCQDMNASILHIFRVPYADIIQKMESNLTLNLILIIFWKIRKLVFFKFSKKNLKTSGKFFEYFPI